MALGRERSVLSKYDEEIDQDAAARRRGFRIGDDAALRAERAREAMVSAVRVAGSSGLKQNGVFATKYLTWATNRKTSSSDS